MYNIKLSIADIPFEIPFRIKRDGVAIVVYQSREGIRAYEDACPHAAWPLSSGVVCDGVLECPGHGWEFNIQTGQCLNAPVYCLTPVTVRVDGDSVHLEYDRSTFRSSRRLAQKAEESAGSTKNRDAYAARHTAGS